jgi:hypothetical protein
MTKRAYNFDVTPSAIKNDTDKGGKPYMTARVSLTLRGKTVERTLQMRGKMIAEVGSTLEVGKASPVRALFERAPANDDNKRGGDFLVAVGLPRVAANA